MTDVEPIIEGVPVGPGHGGEPDSGGPAPSRRADDGPPPLSNTDYSVAFSPRNLAIGLAIVAGLVALAARRGRRRNGPTGLDERR